MRSAVAFLFALFAVVFSVIPAAYAAPTPEVKRYCIGEVCRRYCIGEVCRDAVVDPVASTDESDSIIDLVSATDPLDSLVDSLISALQQYKAAVAPVLPAQPSTTTVVSRPTLFTEASLPTSTPAA
ncbi:hypothetical protein FA95DRAFT_1612611 [Auriscalpium vulgare]|uniref:Uncharacterized protein n=1 Tax=Auriscalpium vulgare TaxID=40419 RepID=A0ACB8R677_9AGAM|nr:hypothetical protein FA95DRAFT_1612611 [Auriscalpium vulgare]